MRPQIAMSAPSAAKFFATPRLMPLPPPVTKTVRPLKRFSAKHRLTSMMVAPVSEGLNRHFGDARAAVDDRCRACRRACDRMWSAKKRAVAILACMNSRIALGKALLGHQRGAPHLPAAQHDAGQLQVQHAAREHPLDSPLTLATTKSTTSSSARAAVGRLARDRGATRLASARSASVARTSAIRPLATGRRRAPSCGRPGRWPGSRWCLRRSSGSSHRGSAAPRRSPR